MSQHQQRGQPRGHHLLILLPLHRVVVQQAAPQPPINIPRAGSCGRLAARSWLPLSPRSTSHLSTLAVSTRSLSHSSDQHCSSPSRTTVHTVCRSQLSTHSARHGKGWPRTSATDLHSCLHPRVYPECLLLLSAIACCLEYLPRVSTHCCFPQSIWTIDLSHPMFQSRLCQI